MKNIISLLAYLAYRNPGA